MENGAWKSTRGKDLKQLTTRLHFTLEHIAATRGSNGPTCNMDFPVRKLLMSARAKKRTGTSIDIADVGSGGAPHVKNDDEESWDEHGAPSMETSVSNRRGEPGATMVK
jgi:hypothetical protein